MTTAMRTKMRTTIDDDDDDDYDDYDGKKDDD